MKGNQPLSYLVVAAKEMGYEYIRIVTNGLFPRSLLDDPKLRFAQEITFSLDGDTAQVHDALRGHKTFARTVENLRAATQLGHTVHVTMCAHRGNVGRTDQGELILSRAINWAADLGVRSFNIHPLFRMGVPRDNWTGETDIDPSAWLETYQEIQDTARRGGYRIPVRVPPRFASMQKFETDTELYGYCSVKKADRMDVHPNGKIHICALQTGTSTAVANFIDQDGAVEIQWQHNDNETTKFPFNSEAHHPCCIIRNSSSELVPLCISLKPGQDEFAWNRKNLRSKA
jgi:sulfatase maturation enzyme AslB (radical SAM superfamily)